MKRIQHALILLILFSASLSAESIFKTGGIAIEGFDAVNYHTAKAAVRGKTDFSHTWNGAKWLFVNQHNRDLFAKNPQQYAPEYGGYCAYAAAKGALAPVDPTVWTIHNDKLYLNFSRGVGEQWNTDKTNHIISADKHWKKLK